MTRFNFAERTTNCATRRTAALLAALLLATSLPLAAQDFGTHTIRYAHDGAARLTQFTVADAAVTIRYDWADGGLLTNRVTGETTVVDTEEEAGAALPRRFALHAAYPNPFSGQATLRYDLPEAASVRLEIYDILGRRVATIVDTRRPAGFHAAEWRAQHLTSGTYFARLTAGRHTFTTTLVKN